MLSNSSGKRLRYTIQLSRRKILNLDWPQQSKTTFRVRKEALSEDRRLRHSGPPGRDYQHVNLSLGRCHKTLSSEGPEIDLALPLVEAGPPLRNRLILGFRF